MIFSENRFPPRIKSGAGCFGIILAFRTQAVPDYFWTGSREARAAAVFSLAARGLNARSCTGTEQSNKAGGPDGAREVHTEGSGQERRAPRGEAARQVRACRIRAGARRTAALRFRR